MGPETDNSTCAMTDRPRTPLEQVADDVRRRINEANAKARQREMAAHDYTAEALGCMNEARRERSRAAELTEALNRLEARR